MTGASIVSNRSAHVRRGSQVKVNLPIFRDEKSKDVVTYHSWWWDVAIFCWSGWDDQHFFTLCLLLTCWLQGFPGDLARSLDEDATLNDILWKLDEHYGVVMTFDALNKELYSLKQGSSNNVTRFQIHLLKQVQILQSEYPGKIQQNTWKR